MVRPDGVVGRWEAVLLPTIFTSFSFELVVSNSETDGSPVGILIGNSDTVGSAVGILIGNSDTVGFAVGILIGDSDSVGSTVRTLIGNLDIYGSPLRILVGNSGNGDVWRGDGEDSGRSDLTRSARVFFLSVFFFPLSAIISTIKNK